MKRIPTGKIFYTFTLLLETTVVFGVYILLATQNHFPQIEPLVNGTAARPFVYRVFPTLLIMLISNISGFSSYLSAIIVMYLSLVGFSYAMWALASFFLPPSSSGVVTLLALGGLLPFLVYQRHIYDFPTLFLFTLALYFLANRRLWLYILVFAITTLTKETSLFLFFFFLLQFRKIGMNKLLYWSMIQICIYSLLRFGIMYLFRNNPGVFIEFHLLDHLYVYRLYPQLTVILFILLMIIAGIAIFENQEKTNFLRNSLIAIGGPTFILYLLFGMPFEMRIFLEAYPSAFLTVAMTAIPLIGRMRARREA